jgi:hypothetical protein
MKNVSGKPFWRKSKNTFMFNSIFFFENYAVYKIMWKKYGTAGRATDDTLAHAHCMPGT